MPSVADLLRAGADLPGESPRRDAEILLGHCLGQSRSWLYTWPEKSVDEADAERFSKMLAARQAGTPIAYILGRREFWSLDLLVNESTLIPRPETETLVAWALALELPLQARALDLGTGTGAIALALATERPAWRLIAAEKSPAALQLAERNRQALGLTNVACRESDWYTSLAGSTFDLIVANPPYIEQSDPHLSEGDVRFEPRSALVADDAGLADLQCVIAGAAAHLDSGGWLLVEHGYEQGPAVRKLFHQAGFTAVETRTDLAGLERITGACRHAD